MATTEVSYTVSNAATKRYSYAGIETFDGTTITDDSLLQVFVNGTQLTLSTQYTVDEVTEEVVIDNAFPLSVSDLLVVRRVTNIDSPFVDFTNSTIVDADDVDLGIAQTRFRLQEIDTGLDNTLQFSSVLNCWDGEGLRACNFANATESTGLTTLGQVQALISGGDPMDTGDGIYDEQSGDGSTTTFTLPDFPTTDIDSAKLMVFIDGIKQRPGIDYTYALNGASVPTVEFLLGAPPTGTNNIHFLVLPGVVTTTYAAASLDGSVIIDATLSGTAIEDGTLDGDALIDGTVPVSKLEFAAGDDDRFLVVDAAGAVATTTITHDDITHTGAGTRTDLGNTNIIVEQSTTVSASGFTYTNSTDKTQFVLISLSSQSGGGSIIMTPDGEAGITMGRWASSGSALHNNQFSFYVPPAAVVSFSVSGTTQIRQLVTQEI